MKIVINRFVGLEFFQRRVEQMFDHWDVLLPSELGVRVAEETARVALVKSGQPAATIILADAPPPAARIASIKLQFAATLR